MAPCVSGATWTGEKDYVYRDTTLLAAVQSTGEVYHLHPDHLGSPRLITRNGGAFVAYHVYHPYGAEATAFNQDTERLKFTGHERDLGLTTSAADDLDYMHARFYNPQLGRFLAVDVKLGKLSRPQSLNRYAYAWNNPMKLTDPNGEAPLPFHYRQFFELVFDTSFSWVDVETNSLANLIPMGANVAAMTVGSTIFLSREGTDLYAAGDLRGITLIGHELAHVTQYESCGCGVASLGINSFLDSYLKQYLESRGRGLSHQEAYNEISFEKEAYVVEADIRTFLQRHPGIAQSMKNGLSLNKQQVKIVYKHFRKINMRQSHRADPFKGTGFCSADNVCH